MISSQAYIAAVIVILAVVAALFFFAAKRRQKSRFTPLAGFAFGFILAGLFFGDDRMIGYVLLGIGVILAVVDMVRQFKKAGDPTTGGHTGDQ